MRMAAETQPDMGIRRCTPADADVLSALACRTFYDTFIDTCTAGDMQDFLEKFYSPSQILRELSDPSEQTFFAVRDEIPVGYVRFLAHPPDFQPRQGLRSLELNRLYVDTAWKGTGVAQCLMDFYVAYAARNDYSYLWLGVWEHNYRAQAFYRKYGFSFTGHRHPFPIGHTPQTDEWWAREMQ